MQKLTMLLVLSALMTSCSAAPAIFSAVDDIATDDAVTASVYKSALQPNADIKVDIQVTNKVKP